MNVSLNVRTTIASMWISLVTYSQLYQPHSTVDVIANNALSPNSVTAFSQLTNAAAQSGHRMTVSLYGEKHIYVKDISRAAFATSFLALDGIAGASLQHFSSPGLVESEIGIRYGRNLGKVDLGIRVTYLMLNLAGYGGDAAFGFDAGAIFRVANTVSVGIRISNPAFARFNVTKEDLPYQFSLGVSYHPADKVFTELHLLKAAQAPLDVRFCLFYKMADQFYMKAGILTGSGSYFAGAGWQKKGIRIMIAVSYQQVLNFTPGIELHYTNGGTPNIKK